MTFATKFSTLVNYFTFMIYRNFSKSPAEDSLYLGKIYIFIYCSLRVYESYFLFSVKPGVRYRDMGAVIQKHAQANGFSVVRSYCGHGIHQYVPIACSLYYIQSPTDSV